MIKGRECVKKGWLGSCDGAYFTRLRDALEFSEALFWVCLHGWYQTRLAYSPTNRRVIFILIVNSIGLEPRWNKKKRKQPPLTSLSLLEGMHLLHLPWSVDIRLELLLPFNTNHNSGLWTDTGSLNPLVLTPSVLKLSNYRTLRLSSTQKAIAPHPANLLKSICTLKLLP